MIGLLLAGVLVSGSVSQTVSTSHAHAGANGGGTTAGTSVNVSKRFPAPAAHANLNGTETLHRCNLTIAGRDVKAVTTDPRGCQYGFPTWQSWWL